jgi:hypothetical protein
MVAAGAAVLASIFLGSCSTGCTPGYQWSSSDQSDILPASSPWDPNANVSRLITPVPGGTGQGGCPSSDPNQGSCIYLVDQLEVVVGGSGIVQIGDPGGGNLASGQLSSDGMTLNLNWETYGGDQRQVTFSYNACT